MKRLKIKPYKKLPKNTKNVARPSRWGNPFKLKKHGGNYSLKESLALYTIWLDNNLKKNPHFLQPLIGYNLGCYCNLDEPCHASILLKYIKIYCTI